MPPKKRAKKGSRNVWYLPIEQGTTLWGPGRVEVTGHSDVFDLKQCIKEELSLRTNAGLLRVFRSKAKLHAKTHGTTQQIAVLQDIDFEKSEEVEEIPVCRKVDTLELDDGEMLIVLLPNLAATELYTPRTDSKVMPQRVELLREEILQSTPSVLGVANEFQKIAGSEHIVYCNRPFEHQKIPLVLLDEVFALFKDRCDQLPTEAALHCLDELMPVACDWYKNDLDRRDRVNGVISARLGLRLYATEAHGSEAGTDGHIWAHVMAAVIRKCKGEPGDVLTQAILYYARSLFCAFTVHHLHDSDSRFPCILMIDMGSYMGFYGAAWDGTNVRVEPLAVFDLAVNWREKKSRYAMASTLDALVVVVKHLKKYYEQLAKTAQKLPIFNPERDRAREFPFLTSYFAGGKRCHFTYKERLNKDQLIFVATPTDQRGDDIIVKFVTEYSEEAHKILAEHEFAPKFLGSVKISSQWKAIIMEKSPYKQLLEVFFHLPVEQKKKIRTTLNKAIGILHNAGYVHGDIRDANILVDLGSLKTRSNAKVHIIDFDWAGKIGEACYPLRVNKISIGRPQGVEGGGKICKPHDSEMVAKYVM